MSVHTLRGIFFRPDGNMPILDGNNHVSDRIIPISDGNMHPPDGIISKMTLILL